MSSEYFMTPEKLLDAIRDWGKDRDPDLRHHIDQLQAAVRERFITCYGIDPDPHEVKVLLVGMSNLVDLLVASGQLSLAAVQTAREHLASVALLADR